MNTVQRFFRRYIFFHNRNHDAVFAANRTPLSMVGEENGRCLCTVQDDRAGIAPEFLKVLNQGDDIASTQDSGGKSEHGLCLKLVMQIFKAHRGTIYFADSPPHGLEVRISLPTSDCSGMRPDRFPDYLCCKFRTGR